MNERKSNTLKKRKEKKSFNSIRRRRISRGKYEQDKIAEVRNHAKKSSINFADQTQVTQRLAKVNR